MHLSRQLGAFVGAGLPAHRGRAHASVTEASNSTLRKLMAEIEDGLRTGESLSECFDRYPKVFPEFYRGILRSAELTGQLDVVLAQLATVPRAGPGGHAARSSRRMVYPAIIAVMALVTVVILAGFVLPRFKVFFEDLDAEAAAAHPHAARLHRLLRPVVVGRAASDSSHSSSATSSRCAQSGGRHARDRIAAEDPRRRR